MARRASAARLRRGLGGPGSAVGSTVARLWERPAPLPAPPREPDFGAVGLPSPSAPAPGGSTLGELMDAYLASAGFAALAPRTRYEYSRNFERLRSVFGAVRPRDWQAAWGEHYLRAAAAPVRANRDMSCLGLIFRRAVAAGLVAANPLRELAKNPEAPRQRYVGDAELEAFLAQCCPRLRSYVALKLCTGLRQGQLLALDWEDWRGGELRAAAAKGGRETIYRGAGLAAAVEDARAAWRSGPAGPLFTAQRSQGRRCTGVALRRRWAAAMRRHLDAAAGNDAAARAAAHFVEHDLRAKVATDSGDLALAQARLGHVTSAVTARVYMRGPRRVEAAAAKPAQGRLFD